jgi:hypothetical protein
MLISVLAALTLIVLEAAPDATGTPFTVIEALGSDATGVMVMLVAE